MGWDGMPGGDEYRWKIRKQRIEEGNAGYDSELSQSVGEPEGAIGEEERFRSAVKCS